MKERRAQRAIFEEWYRLDRNFGKLRESLAAKQGSAAPSQTTLYRWIDEFDWHARADALDREAERKRLAQAMREVQAMRARHAALARNLQGVGSLYFQRNKDQEITREEQAIRAIIEGVRLERQAQGLPDFVTDILAKDDNDLAEFIARALGNSAGRGAEAGAESGAAVAIRPVDYRTPFADTSPRSSGDRETPSEAEILPDGSEMG